MGRLVILRFISLSSSELVAGFGKNPTTLTDTSYHLCSQDLQLYIN
jgi:hypothetical protein